MTLGRLTRLARHELEDEMTQLRETIAELEAILADDGRLRGVIKTELAEVRAEHATPRIAKITFDPGDMNVEDLIDDKDLLVIMTRAGYIKSVEADAFRTQGRGGRGVAGGKLKEEDLVKTILHTSAHAYLLFFSNKGRVYRLRAHEIPERDRTAKGIPIVNLLPLTPDEHIQAIIDTRDYETNRYLFFATKHGQVKKTLMSEYDKSRREGFIAINLREGDELVQVIQTNGTEDVLLVSRKGMGIRFTNDDEQVRPMGRDAAGVRGMKLKAGDEVVACDIARRRRRRAHRHRRRLRQAHQDQRVQRAGSRRPGRQGDQARIDAWHRDGRVHGREPRRRGDVDLVLWCHDPARHRHDRPRAARSRCDGRQGREPRRWPDRRLGGPRHPSARGRLTALPLHNRMLGKGTRMNRRARGMEGQVTPLVAVAVLLAGGIALVVGHIGGMLADHAQARAAADAAALAGAMAGEAAAEEAATSNGGTLVEIETSGADTEVRVRVGDAVAVARARRGLSQAAEATAFTP